MNGSAVPVALKNRPRIPTPDVTKEVVDRENKLASMNIAQNATSSMSTVTSGPMVLNGTHHQSHHNHNHHQGYSTELPLVQVVLSPIQELENGSGMSQHQATPGGTAALAQAVLSPALTTAGISSVTLNGAPGTATVLTTPVNMAVSTVTLTPVTMSQPLLTSLGFHSTTPPQSLQVLQHPTVTLTEVNSSAEEDVSTSVNDNDRSRKTSVASQANSTSKRGEVYV